jgi:tape measure domain-containing protein
MPDQTVRIIFMSSGAEKVAKDVQNIGENAKKSDKETGTLLDTLKGFLTLNSVKGLAEQFIELSDTYTVFQNRVRSTTSSQAEALIVGHALVNVANETRASLDQVGETYQHIALVTQQYNISASEQVGITKTLLESFTLMTGDSSKAGQAVSQLSIALDQGTISGRQFRTLIGSQPALVNELAKALGVSVAQLKQLGSEGKLSAQELIQAFEVAAPQIDAAFQRIQPTISSRFQQIQNTLVESAHNADNNGRLQNFANNLSVGLDVWLLGYDRAHEKFLQAQQDMKNLATQAQIAQEKAKRVPTDLSANQTEFLKTTTETLTHQNSLLSDQARIGTDAYNVDKLRIALQDKGVLSLSHFNDLLAQGKTIGELRAKGYTTISDDQYKTLVDLQHTITLQQIQVGLVKEIGGTQGDYNNKLEAANALLDTHGTNLEKVKELILKIKSEQLGFNPDAGSATERGGLLIQQAQGDSRDIADLRLKSWQQAAGAAKQYQDTLLAIQANERDGAISADEATRQSIQAQLDLLKNKTDVMSGLARGFDQIRLEANDFASSAEQTVTDAFHGMEDAVVEFVKTGKLDFSSLVDSILGDLTRLLLKQAVEAPLLNLFGGLFGSVGGGAGGIFGSFGSLFGGGTPHAGGGAVSAGTAYTVGERGPEMFVPQNSGTIIPNGGGQSAPPQVNITVVNTVDMHEEVTKALADPKTDQVFVNKVSRNRSPIKQGLGG